MKKYVLLSLFIAFAFLHVLAQPRTRASVLSNGDIYKISTINNGIHQLSYDFLKNTLKIDVDKVDAKTIKLYGKGGGMLPEKAGAARVDDLAEIPMQLLDKNANGKLDAEDAFLFYGESPDKLFFDKNTKQFSLKKHLYDDKNYYFVKISGGDGLRIAKQNNISNTAFTSNQYNAVQHFEEEKINILGATVSSVVQGSGKKWFGDKLSDSKKEISYAGKFNFPNLIKTQPVQIQAEIAARSGADSRFSISVDGQTLTSPSIWYVLMNDLEASYASTGRIESNFKSNTDNINLSLQFLPTQSNAEAWVDFITLNATCALQMAENQLIFRDINTLNYASTTFQVGNASNNTQVWDITNPIKPSQQESLLSNNALSFGANTTDLKEFIAFDANSNLLSPSFVNKVENQNLHSIDEVDLLIIYHKDFETAALKLARHREKINQYNVATARIDQIYNEFSGGGQDLSAIRDFAKMLYERNKRFKYLLLMGDGSYDPKDRTAEKNTINTFIPTFQTEESFDPILAYPSDDYFALLSDKEDGSLVGALDIAVGRLPVSTATQASEVVEKIIAYDSNPASLGDWRNKIAFMADDEDSNIHFNQANNIADDVSKANPTLNVEKIFLDAYQQISTAGSPRYPDANETLNKDLYNGVLVVNYLGHGSPRRLAQEALISNPSDILGWTNFYKLPLFITATCSFSAFDNPTFVSGGENVLLNPRGGGIALFSTVRAVYSSSNERLTRSVFNTLFGRNPDGSPLAIGEILRRAKNLNPADTASENARKFMLLGDPSMKLGLPDWQVKTLKINGKDFIQIQKDTFSALQKVKIEGAVTDFSGNILTNFNGKVYPQIYDKAQTLKTLANDAQSRQQDFSVQKNIIYKGVATVKNGLFAFEFVVPKDINYSIGLGKISYYATDGVSVDAGGAETQKILIGGTSPNVNADDKAPELSIFLNSEQFKNGDNVNDKPILWLNMADDNGINVSGNSIGHDLTAVLDEDTKNSFRLNEYYEGTIDDYKKGKVRFPLPQLSEGKHTLSAKIWDIANNSTKKSIEFIVSTTAKGALEAVLAYPNPFVEQTTFQFQHQLSGEQALKVQVQIYSISGVLIKTIEQTIASSQSLVNSIQWDGLDNNGNALSKGLYIYKINVKNITGDKVLAESKAEKVILLK